MLREICVYIYIYIYICIALRQELATAKILAAISVLEERFDRCVYVITCIAIHIHVIQLYTHILITHTITYNCILYHTVIYQTIYLRSASFPSAPSARWRRWRRCTWGGLFCSRNDIINYVNTSIHDVSKTDKHMLNIS